MAALVFGILISAAVRISLSRTPLHRIFSGVTVHDQLAAALAGAALMLCSCCAAPMFPAVYQTTQKIELSLALVLAAASLNPSEGALAYYQKEPQGLQQDKKYFGNWHSAIATEHQAITVHSPG